MKIRPLSVCIGIVQTFAVFAYPSLLFAILDIFHVDDWVLTGNNAISICLLSLLIIGTLILGYPIYLFRKKQQTDAFVVICSTVISLLIFLTFFFIEFNRVPFPD